MAKQSKGKDWRDSCEPLIARVRRIGHALRGAMTDLAWQSGTYEPETGGMIVLGPTRRWLPLAGDGVSALRAARSTLTEYRDVVRVVVSAVDKYHLPEVNGALGELEVMVDRSTNARAPADQDDLPAWVEERLGAIERVVDGLPLASPLGEALVIPDTMAVLHQPRWEQWAPALGEATLLLLPTVLQEMDDKKLHQKPEVRRKAELFANMLTEMLRRGAAERPAAVAGKLKLLILAVEPAMTASLPWLRSEKADDRLIASTLEISASNPAAQVLLVTRDNNLQAKAQTARLCWARPDDLDIPREEPPPEPAPAPPVVALPQAVAQFDPQSFVELTTAYGPQKRQNLEVLSLSPFPIRLANLVVNGASTNFTPQVLPAHGSKVFSATFPPSGGALVLLQLTIERADASGTPLTLQFEFQLGPMGLAPFRV